jgi:iron-sulfur cluster repair protein YtfE (RIC family)
MPAFCLLGGVGMNWPVLQARRDDAGTMCAGHGRVLDRRHGRVSLRSLAALGAAGSEDGGEGRTMALFARDVFDQIRDDHRAVMEIFRQLEELDESSVGRRSQLIQQLQDDLLPHMAAEENVFYPHLENGARNHERHLHADEEHRAARMVLRDIAGMDPNDEHFMARCSVLKDLLKMHIAEEESIIFLTVRTKITNQQTIDMLGQFQAFKEQFKRQRGAGIPKAA